MRGTITPPINRNAVVGEGSECLESEELPEDEHISGDFESRDLLLSLSLPLRA